jgi:hypothetical protein
MELEAALADHHAAVEAFIAAARAMSARQWTTPRAPGKWTPAQIVEHLAITYEWGVELVKGTPPGGGAPFFMRPIIRRMFVIPSLKAGRFTRAAKTLKIFEPSAAPPASAVVLPRLESAVASFETAIRSGRPGASQALNHPLFGSIPATEYLQLQSIHARHHHAQLAASAAAGGPAPA